MANVNISDSRHSHRNLHHITCLSWRSIFAGLAISALVFLILGLLGAAFGGSALSDLEGLNAFSWGAATWTVLTTVISLFVGAYAASRISNYVSPQVGVVQAMTIASLFFAFMLWSGTTFVGNVSGIISGAAAAVLTPLSNSTQSIGGILRNQEVMGFARQELQALGIKPAEVDELAVGVLSRLLSGDKEAAKNYISSRTNIDPNSVEARINELEITVMGRVRAAASNAASMFSAASWFLFFLTTLSTVSSVFGGVLGSKRNAKDSLERVEMAEVNYAA